MTATTARNLYVTNVEKFGTFLRIWGQIDKNFPVIIENSLMDLTPQFDQGHYVPALDGIQIGLFCCAKYKDGRYYRARVTNITMLQQHLVEVHFIDYGNKEILPIVNLRSMVSFAPGLITIPSQASDFVLANVTHLGLSWDNNTITLVTNEIRYMDLQFIVVHQVNTHTLIKLYKNGEDFALSLFNRGLVLSMASVSQNMILQSAGSGIQQHLISNTVPPSHTQVVVPAVVSPQPIVTQAPALLSYKAVTIEPDSDYNVYVSYVSDGPCQFSVQLQKLEDNLARLMRELNRMTLQPLEEDPLPGTVCVAKCIEDDHICRAVVTSMVDGQYKVFYVDFGNTEIVPITNLYQIPFKYVIIKVMAMRYALEGLERSSVTLEMKCAFKDFVSDKLLRMRSMLPPTKSALPLCTLWDDNNVNVLDVLKKAAMLAYPDVLQLTRGFNQEVLVSYVYSCSHFYVQVKTKEEELRTVMAELQVKCPKADAIQVSQVKVGLPCCALFDADGQWYRAQILSNQDNIIKVRYVDYGNEELVSISNLRMPIGNLLAALRPQALECCLNGYQNMADDVERDNILEEIILEKEFTMRVIEMQNSRALVDLIDGSRYNVGSLLLEKLASARSQASPLLIQESYQIEQRKRHSPTATRNGYQNKFERNNSRENDEKPWLNEKGFSPKDSNDRGYNQKTSERDYPKRDLNDRLNKGSRDTGFARHETNDKVHSSNNEWEQEDSNKQDANNDEWNNNKKQDSWRQNRPPRKEFDKEGGWNGDRNNDRNKREWSREGSRGDHTDKGGGGGGDGSWRDKKDGFKKDNWGDSAPSWKQNDKSPSQRCGGTSKRDGSEKSWDGDKNWRRNQRSTDDDRPFKRDDFKSRGNNEHFSGSRKTDRDIETKTVEDRADNSAVYAYPDVNGKCEEVLISWFHNPASFFCQLKESEAQFRTLVDDIQNCYCKIKPGSAPVGAPVIALFPEDGVLYRAYVSEMKGTQYYVQFVDFGNSSTTSKVWPIEKKFMSLPAQAICCSLNGLLPVDENGAWSNIESYSAHFNKETFMCTFTSGDNLSYLVDLTADGQNISETLVSAGLAKFAEYFDPSILCGQQVQVTLGEIQGLDCFYVFLQSGVQLLCTIHNLEAAKETFEETLKEYVGYNVIMYVDNLLEEKTQVTLYDTTGMKIKTIEPDEGAYDTIEPLCPLPVLNATLNGWISFLAVAKEQKYKVFIQPAEHADTVTQLLERLYNHYESITLEESLQPEVGFYYAVHSADGNWYRGLVLSVEEQNVTLTYIDYGNSETVSVSELRELTQEFKELHMLALEATSSNVDDSFAELEVSATVWYGETGWEAEIYKQGEETTPDVVVEVAAEEVISAEAAQPATEEAVVQSVADGEYTQIGVSVCLSHVDTPNEFYLQLFEAVETIENLQASLQEQVEGYPDLESPAAGALCAAPYSLDQQWYRAQVLDADSDITTVRFVDYGNTDVITNATTTVKTLSPDMLALEQYARRCSLLVKPLDNVEWTAASSERFEALTNCDNLAVEIIHQEEKTTYVDLYANGENVANILLQEGLAIKLELEIESSCTGYVSNLNSPSEFWVQLENSVADLEWIAEQLSSAANFPELEDLTPGALCAALYTEDEMWYRARILSNTVAGLEVVFIDYGNSCTCTSLRQLPEDLIMLPALAQKCSLQKPEGILQWPLHATDEFKNISADGATIFNIDKLSTGETLIVRLLLNDEDISVHLLPKIEYAYISFIDSIASFWVQKTADETKLNEISEKLINAYDLPKCEEPEVDKIVAAQQVDDELWYRARIISINEDKYEVSFIDFGNVGNTSEIRLLGEDDAKHPSIANKYKLEPLPGFRWIHEDATKQLEEISNDGATIFETEFVSEDVVRLYVNGIDIRSNMDSACIASVQSSPKKATPIHSSVKTAEPLDFKASEDNETLHVELENNDETISENLTQGIEFLEVSKEPKDTDYNVRNTEFENIVNAEGQIDNSLEVVDNIEKVSTRSAKTLERRPSTPHCEKIVPGSICRGDLTELDTEQGSIEIEGTGTLESDEIVDHLSKAGVEDGGDIENCLKLRDDLATVNLERRPSTPHSDKIVPGSICRGDLTEVADTKGDCTDLNEIDTPENQIQSVDLSKDDMEDDVNIENCERRPSTPQSDKIVPGSICRGDLTEASDIKHDGIDLKEAGTPDKSHESTDDLSEGDDENLKCVSSYDLSKDDIEDSVNIENCLKLSNDAVTTCNLDRRPSTPLSDKIVPGSICRGDLTEVAYTERDCTNLKGAGTPENQSLAPDVDDIPDIVDDLQLSDDDDEVIEVKEIEGCNISLAAELKAHTPVYTPERRSSTPHCDKIVPGSCSRGDLTEVSDGASATVANEAEIKMEVIDDGKSEKDNDEGLSPAVYSSDNNNSNLELNNADRITNKGINLEV